ncbi:hypothetical protein EVAR_78703_1 [Eumeta japonica]|uniref:Uncharacterized protein n=1 Tax=Eumeta variegata TaxID=151549 RepID=A0A4C1T416_EUMVA|nr:hypothetical protein EVAR_78703_1 [Eumeta japonica]
MAFALSRTDNDRKTLLKRQGHRIHLQYSEDSLWARTPTAPSASGDAVEYYQNGSKCRVIAPSAGPAA